MSDSAITLRKATREDVPLVMEFIPEVVALLNADGNYQWNDTYPLASDFMKDVEDNVLWVAVDDSTGKMVGVAALTTDQYPEYADVGWDLSEVCIVPHRVAVSPHCRGRGIAQKLLLKGDDVAREMGLTMVRVDTNVQNKTMRHIFEKLGYQHAGDVQFKWKPDTMWFCCYSKKV